MLVYCKNYNGLSCRFRNVKINNCYHKYNFRLHLKHDFKENKHKHLVYFNENYKRYDKKCNKIAYHEFKKSLNI